MMFPALGTIMPNGLCLYIQSFTFPCADLGPRSSGCRSGRLFPCILTGKGDPQNILTRCTYYTGTGVMLKQAGNVSWWLWSLMRAGLHDFAIELLLIMIVRL